MSRMTLKAINQKSEVRSQKSKREKWGLLDKINSWLADMAHGLFLLCGAIPENDQQITDTDNIPLIAIGKLPPEIKFENTFEKLWHTEGVMSYAFEYQELAEQFYDITGHNLDNTKVTRLIVHRAYRRGFLAGAEAICANKKEKVTTLN